MRVVFVLSQSLESPSGLGRFGPIAREMSRLGHKVEIIALHHDWGKLQNRRFQDRGVDVHYVGQMHVHKVGSQKQYYSPGKLFAISLLGAVQLARFLGLSKADIIQLCKPQPINSLAVKWGRRGRQVYCDCDDYEAVSNRFANSWEQKIVRFFEDDTVRFAHGITVNTTFTRERFFRLGYPLRQIVYVPNGVEPARFTTTRTPETIRKTIGIAQDDKVIMYLGSLSLSSHPIDLLLTAFLLVLKHDKTARLLIVGGGEDYHRLIRMASDLGIDQRTTFTGRISPVEVANYLSIAQLSVDPVKDDLIAQARFPLKIIESITMGIPVVTGDVGDRQDILEDGRLGLLTPPGDPQPLAEAILSIIEDCNKQAQIRQAALKSRERWYWNHLIHDFMKVYSFPSNSISNETHYRNPE